MESGVEPALPRRIPWTKRLLDQHVLTQEIVNYKYKGSGTEDDPYLVEWIPNDPRDPMGFPNWIKWSITQIAAFATLAVSFCSSAYASGIPQIKNELGGSLEVNTLGITLFLLGFAPGPFLWAPMSELYGRQYLFFATYLLHVVFNAAAGGSNSLATLLVLRFFAGLFGAAPLTNSGGVIADMFPASQRGLAMTLFAAAPFLGPILGPIVGGFVSESIGWRWLEGIMAIFTAILFVIGIIVIPETYGPVLLRRRANNLSKRTGKIYKSRIDAARGKVEPIQAFGAALSRPWKLLFLEPIVLLLSLYLAIIFGTLYLLFGAFPIVYEEYRGWSQGIGGLAFLGVMLGMVCAIIYSMLDNKRYINTAKRDPSGFASPEARLPPVMIGGCAIPIGLFWFAWTNSPNISWVASVAAGVPFGFGMVLIFLGSTNYLIDAYTIYAASVLAAGAFMRAIFGAAFPLFTNYLFGGLGIHWGSSVPAFLALACTPFPFLFYLYGSRIRTRCKYAAEANIVLLKIRGQLPEQLEANVAVSENGIVQKDADSEQDEAVTCKSKEKKPCTD